MSSNVWTERDMGRGKKAKITEQQCVAVNIGEKKTSGAVVTLPRLLMCDMTCVDVTSESGA